MQRIRFLLVASFIVALYITTTAFIEASNTTNQTVSVQDLVLDTIRKEESKIYTAQQDQLKEALNTYFQKALAAGDIVGVGVSIVQGDSILISDGFGKRSVNENTVVDGETVFRLGSLSKGFGGVLAASLNAIR